MVLEKEPVKIEALVIGPERPEETVSGFYVLNTTFINLKRKARHAILKYSFDFYVPNFMDQLNRGETIFDRSENCFLKNRRSKKRWAIHLPISYRFSTKNGPKEVLGVSEDISMSGQSAVFCFAPLPLMEPLEFTIDLVQQQIKGQAIALREKTVQFGGIERRHFALKIEKIHSGDVRILQALSKMDYLLRG